MKEDGSSERAEKGAEGERERERKSLSRNLVRTRDSRGAISLLAIAVGDRCVVNGKSLFSLF